MPPAALSKTARILACEAIPADSAKSLSALLPRVAETFHSASPRNRISPSQTVKVSPRVSPAWWTRVRDASSRPTPSMKAPRARSSALEPGESRPAAAHRERCASGVAGRSLCWRGSRLYRSRDDDLGHGHRRRSHDRRQAAARKTCPGRLSGRPSARAIHRTSLHLRRHRMRRSRSRRLVASTHRQRMARGVRERTREVSECRIQRAVCKKRQRAINCSGHS